MVSLFSSRIRSPRLARMPALFPAANPTFDGSSMQPRPTESAPRRRRRCRRVDALSTTMTSCSMAGGDRARATCRQFTRCSRALKLTMTIESDQASRPRSCRYGASVSSAARSHEYRASTCRRVRQLLGGRRRRRQKALQRRRGAVDVRGRRRRRPAPYTSRAIGVSSTTIGTPARQRLERRQTEAFVLGQKGEDARLPVERDRARPRATYSRISTCADTLFAATTSAQVLRVATCGQRRRSPSRAPGPLAAASAKRGNQIGQAPAVEEGADEENKRLAAGGWRLGCLADRGSRSAALRSAGCGIRDSSRPVE